MGHTYCHGDAPSVIPGDSQSKGQLCELTRDTAPVERWLNVRNHPNVLLQRRASRQEGRLAPLLTVRPPPCVVYTGHGKPHHENITWKRNKNITGCKFSREHTLLSLALVEVQTKGRVWCRQKNVR